MVVLDQNDINELAGREVYDPNGDKIGTIKQIYTDDETGQADWVTVRTGLFGTNETFIPLSEASLSGQGLTVPYEKSFVKDAPNIDEDGHISVEQERELYAYYNRGGHDYAAGDTARASDRGRTETPTQTEDGRRTVDGTEGVGTVNGTSDVADADRSVGSEGYDTSGPTTDDAMTVSEERLRVGTEQRDVGRARLRKYVVTENVTQTVPVQREEVRLEREPITDANSDAATSGPDISEEEHEVVLHEERAVVQKETVPVERVRMSTDTVTDQETVGDEVRKERVEVDGDIPNSDRV